MKPEQHNHEVAVRVLEFEPTQAYAYASRDPEAKDQLQALDSRSGQDWPPR